MKKLRYFFLLVTICYSPYALCEWNHVSSNENFDIYISNKIAGKYWIRGYSELMEYKSPSTVKVAGNNVVVKSIVQDRVVDCLFGNLNIRKSTFYSDTIATGQSYVPNGGGFSDSTHPKKSYDYRWFQFNREYNDDVFKNVCGDIYTLRDLHLFWKIPRQSAM